MTTPPYIPKPASWFIERIGKRIYRGSQDRGCEHCKRVTEIGLIIRDESHAQYLADVDSDFAAEGVFSNYRDTK